MATGCKSLYTSGETVEGFDRGIGCKPIVVRWSVFFAGKIASLWQQGVRACIPVVRLQRASIVVLGVSL